MNSQLDSSKPVPPLKVCRVAAGLTQAQLAAAAGVHEKTISNAERGVVVLRRRSAQAIAAVLQVDVDLLFPQADEQACRSPR